MYTAVSAVNAEARTSVRGQRYMQARCDSHISNNYIDQRAMKYSRDPRTHIPMMTCDNARRQR